MSMRFNHLVRWFRADFCSPKDFVRHAVLIVVLFAVAHLCGLREYTTIITGTMASPALGAEICALLGVAYMALYFGVVVFVPVLLLAAALLKLLQHFTQRHNHEP